jgi:phytoene dehydrogenase-like protein
MSELYDVIVVGGGMGGLSAATSLARSGRKVLLLERHGIPGGYATSFVRGRYEFEVALHEFSGIDRGHSSAFYQYLDSLGVASRLEFVNIEQIYRSVFPGIDISLPSGEEAFIGLLCSAFPHEAAGIRRFIDRVLILEREVSQMEEQFTQKGLTLPMLAKVPFNYPNALKYLPVTWDSVLSRDVKDPVAKAVISQYWGYFGLPPSRVSFFYFAMGLAGYIRYGASFPKGRSQALSHAFISAFEAWGGEARMRCAVRSVRQQNGRVTGVLTEDGNEYRCKALISNVDPVTLCHDLIGRENVPTRYWRRLRNSRPGPSSVNVYIGAGRTAEELGMTDHEAFVNSDLDIDAHYLSMQHVGPPGAMAVTNYNNVYPEVSPPGTSITVLTALYYGEPWTKLAPEEYLDAKHRVADTMLTMSERVMPGLREYAETIEVSTPLTNMRYAGNMFGSIYGFEQPPWDHTVVRLGQKGPLEGLFLAGAWTQPGGGFQPAISSGKLTAALVGSWLNGGPK